MPDGSPPEPTWEQVAIEVSALLFENGQTTEGVLVAADALCPAGTTLTARWGELIVWPAASKPVCRIAATPLSIDIGRVAAVERVLAQGVAIGPSALRTALALARARPAVSLRRFASMAAAGATGLAVIFGASQPLTLASVFASAGLGACLRRALEHASPNPFLQPFGASVLAGAIAGGCIVSGVPISGHLLAVCPCMVLIPGPHVLNGSIDLIRARIPLGAARLAYASVIVLAVCAGLLLGLSLWGATLEPAGAAPVVPLGYDVCAAGIAVAAYGSFFNMPWRMLPIPVVVGMLAHAFRWFLLSAGFSVQSGAFAACLLVGAAAAALARRLRIPFGALAFASVVSLMPGVFLFQAAAEAMALIGGQPGDATSDLLGLARNGVTAILVAAAITTGLIIPKLCMDQFLFSAARPAKTDGDRTRAT